MEIRNRYTNVVIATGDDIKRLAEEKKANLYGANLREANLCEANLCEANLREANLCEANLREANLYGADLREANLREANLYGADLREADLCGADLRGADLREADLREADLCGADLRGANLRGAKYGKDELLLKYLSIGPIGSRNDYLQVFVTDKQTILKTGCWTGTIEELESRTGRVDYQSAVQFVKALGRG